MNVWLDHSFNGATDGETHVEVYFKKECKTKLAIERMARPFAQGTYGSTIHAAGDGKTRVEGTLKKTIRPTLAV